MFSLNNKVRASDTKLNEYYGLSLTGTTVRLDLNKEFLRSVAPITCEGVLESEIEKAIYSREIDQAQDLLLTYSSNSTLSIPICSLQRLTNLCCKEEAPNPEEWSISSINVGQIEIFKSTAVKMATTCPFDVNLPVSVSDLNFVHIFIFGFNDASRPLHHTFNL